MKRKFTPQERDEIIDTFRAASQGEPQGRLKELMSVGKPTAEEMQEVYEAFKEAFRGRAPQKK